MKNETCIFSNINTALSGLSKPQLAMANLLSLVHLFECGICNPTVEKAEDVYLVSIRVSDKNTGEVTRLFYPFENRLQSLELCRAIEKAFPGAETVNRL